MKPFSRLILLLSFLLAACAPKPLSRAADPTSPAPEQFSLVQLHTDQGKLKELLAAEAQKAAEAGRSPFVEMTAAWCAHCKALNESLGDPRMTAAFSGTHIILLDYDEWKRQLPASGLLVFGVPAFFELDEQGRATGRTLTGAAWEEDIPENMAPPLKEFFHPAQ